MVIDDGGKNPNLTKNPVTTTSAPKTRAIRDLALSERDLTMKDTGSDHNADKSPIKLEKASGKIDILCY